VVHHIDSKFSTKNNRHHFQMFSQEQSSPCQTPTPGARNMRQSKLSEPSLPDAANKRRRVPRISEDPANDSKRTCTPTIAYLPAPPNAAQSGYDAKRNGNGNVSKLGSLTKNTGARTKEACGGECSPPTQP